MALLQLQDAEGDVEKIILGNLEQLIPGVGLEDVEKRLAIVAGRVEAGARHRTVQLLPEQRDTAWADVIGVGGEQADEAVFADDPALGVEGLDADGVHMDRPVHRRFAVGLGDQEQRRLADQLARVGRQGGRGARRMEDGEPPVPEDPQTRVLDDGAHHQLVAAGEFVGAIAEEGEMVIIDPEQEFPGLLGVLLGDAGRRLLHLVQDVADLVPHRLPVLDRDANTAEHALDIVAGFLHLPGGEMPVDLDVHVGFVARRARIPVVADEIGDFAPGVALYADDGMGNPVDGHSAFVERRRHRIDEERHIVVDDLEHGVAGIPAMLLEARGVDPDLRLARLARGGKAPQRKGGAEQVLRGILGHVVGGGGGVVSADEALGQCRAVALEMARGERRDLVDHVGLESRRLFHLSPSFVSLRWPARAPPSRVR